MNKWLTAGLMIILAALAGCTPSIYGVPQDRWDTLGEQERIAAMEAYQVRQESLRQQREERARQQAIEQERQAAIAAEEARQQMLRIDAIYRGEGVYGDLLRVTLQDGRMKLRGSHRAYQPVAFRIAAGETREVQVVDLKGRATTLAVGYDGSTLLLDDRPGAKRSPVVPLVYDDAWERGKSYPDFATRGPLELNGVTVTVQVLGDPPRERQSRRGPQVIVIQAPAPPPGPPPGAGDHKPPLHDRHDPAVRKNPDRRQPDDAPPSRLKVTFRKGQIQVKGKTRPIDPQAIELREGESRTITLRSGFGQVKIQVSYQKGELVIDDHPGNASPGTRLGFNKEWRNGSGYQIKTAGNRMIEDLDVFIVAM